MKNTIMYPGKLSGPTAPEDMPENVRDIYEEARSVAAVSARSAAALLRLALEQLVNDLEPDGTTLNDKIGRLYGRGLDPKVVQTMDVIRGFGNTAGAHVGEIDLKDDPDTVAMLFSLLLIVVEQVITRPKHVDALFDRLPAGVREAIEKRNAKAAAKNQTAT